MNPRYSLVVPLYNEAGNVTTVVAGAVEVLSALGQPFEVVLVDDASSDSTPREIALAAARWPECRGLRLPAHSGQAAALLAGLGEARGEQILTMDGDGQNDPRDFPALLELAASGRFDLVCGWRVDRRDGWLRRAMSRLANSVRRSILADRVHDAGCQLRVMRSAVRTALRPMELLQSFVPALAVAAGFRVGEIPVRHHPRMHGRSKYGLAQLWWRPAAAMLRLRWDLWRRPTP
jgi:glycosyltransferase involved in cell wall biosynthesis